MTFDTWVSLSAQISHHQCIWAAEVDLCSRSMMWLFHWPLFQWPLPAENHAFQTYLCLHNNMLCFILCGLRMISVNINTNIFEYNSSSNTAISAYLQMWSLKLRCNQLAGNNTLMKRFPTGRWIFCGGHSSTPNHYVADSFLRHVNMKSISLGGWDWGCP